MASLLTRIYALCRRIVSSGITGASRLTLKRRYVLTYVRPRRFASHVSHYYYYFLFQVSLEPRADDKMTFLCLYAGGEYARGEN